MNETPRLRSAFPTTPRTGQRYSPLYGGNVPNHPTPQPIFSNSSRNSTPIIKIVRTNTAAGKGPNEPLIPLDVVDAPSQRLYVVAFYVALTAWRIYNCWNISDELDSTWLFLKWIGIDAGFFVGLPAFHIPRFRWSFSTTLAIWLLHAVVNAFMMYQIPIPLSAWLAALLKVAYDRELAISEHRINPASILHNSSIIAGKQVIKILPEGSAILNPEKESFCLDWNITAVELPIRINQTAPMLIELLRTDLDTQETETITINAKQARALKRQADKSYPKTDTNNPRTLRYSTSKKGSYQLLRVVDESKLEVRKRTADTLVVSCPKASLTTGNQDRCTGDLSDVSLAVSGTPPFKVRYSKQVNKQQSSSVLQSVQPANLESPLVSGSSGTLVDPKAPNFGWTRSSTVTVDISESLHQNGTWSYNVEDVEDGLGNKVWYTQGNGHARKHHDDHQSESLTVHHRPKIFLAGCDGENFLRVAKEQSVNLPVKLRPADQLSPHDWPLTLKYSFVPDGDDTSSVPRQEVFEMASDRSSPRISQAGKYSISSIQSQFCSGEINEPSSCLLYNPPHPDLAIDKEDIFDKCAGRPIGMIVNLDLTGSPPFRVRYTITHRGNVRPMIQEFRSLRGQMEFKESQAGSYVYHFLEIADDVYGPRSLKDKALVLEQDIKPPASAAFNHGPGVIKACLGQPISLDVNLYGDAPWDLEYEVVHLGRRKKFSAHSETALYSISIPDSLEGGKQTVILTSVQDNSKCRTSIKEERTIEVRPEQPQASFGDIEGRRSISSLQGKTARLPLRLKGLAPWTVRVTNLAHPSDPAVEHLLREPNAAISVNRPGTYEIMSVHDTCPGIVDPIANSFVVSWINRPTVEVNDLSVLNEGNQLYRKPAVCEGDDALLGLSFTGSAPFHVKYLQRSQPIRGAAGVSNKELSAAARNAVVSMDTSKAGELTYTFTELSDELYDHDRKGFAPLVVHHHVYPLPAARFSQPGKTYGYCKGDTNGGENIPISLQGSPPFAIEIAVTHHGNARPEISRVKDILSNEFSWHLSRQALELGTHIVNIRSVKDSRGCEQTVDNDPSSVRIMISDPPSIYPMEAQTDYCVGEHVTYTLSGQPPFEIFYNFQGHERKAKSATHTFRRIAEQPGKFTITAISDNASGKCKATKEITKFIHPMPSVKISKGKEAFADIHEGGEVEIVFDFTGTPPFEFTYTRSENAKRGKKGAVIETRNLESHEYSKSIRASDEGTYEVVAIKDKYCSFSLQKGGGREKSQKLLT